VFWTSFYH